MNEEEVILEEGDIDNVSFNDEGQIIGKKGQYEDPRQQLCWDYYVQGFVAGSPNLKAAAMKAGYTEISAEKVRKTKWFIDRNKKLKRSDMFSKAEKNLRDVLNLKYIFNRKVGGEMVDEVDTDVLRIIVDVSKSLVKSLGKDEGYSDRSEVTGKGGEPVMFMPLELINKHNLDK